MLGKKCIFIGRTPERGRGYVRNMIWVVSTLCLGRSVFLSVEPLRGGYVGEGIIYICIWVSSKSWRGLGIGYGYHLHFVLEEVYFYWSNP